MEHPACPGGPRLHPHSELSCSSGASRPSTRPPSPAPSSRRSSSLVELDHLTTSTIEQRTGNTRLDLAYAMDNTATPFDGGNNRRSRLASERSGTTSYQQQQQQQQQQPTGGPVSPQASRNLTSSNWRANVLNESHESDLPYWQRLLRQQYSHAVSFESPARGEQHQQQADAPTPTASTSYKPLTVADGWYAYCFDRGNGQYTRLIPADMLPPLRDIPAVQQGCLGMIVLPQPRSGPAQPANANGPSSPAEPAGVRTPPVTPAPPADIQTHIDTIVATTPSTPTQQGQGQGSSSGSGSASSSAPSTARARVIPVPMKMPLASAAHGGLQNSYHAGAPLPQHAQTSQQQQQQHPQQPPPPPPAPLLQSAPFPTRRPKIYCDKWVHEGVCAFTQQGCKYKHEMPLDKVTQHQLGLFHGLPAWWKKHQAELARQREPAGGAGEPEPRLVGEGAGRASNVAVPHHHLHHVHQGGGGPGPMGGAAGTGVLGARGGRSAAGSSVLGDNHHSHNNSNNSNNNTMPWRRATGPAVADRNSTGPHHPQLGQPLSPHRLGTGGRHPTMVSSNLITSRGASLAPWNKSPYGPIAPPTPAPNASMVLPTRSVATNNPYATLETMDEDPDRDATRTG